MPATLGCQYANVPDGTACDNGSKKCFNGQCLAGSVHLRLYLNFEEGQGNTAHDLAPSGNQTNGTLYGNTSFASPGKLGDYCLKVDGTTAADRVTLAGNISDLNMASEYTYMLWMKSYQSGSKGLIGLGSCCNTRQGYTMNINGSGEVRFWGGSDSNDNNYNTYAGGQPVHDGNWHHIAIRVKPGSLQILVDGSVKANGESNIPTSPSLAPANNSNITYVPHVGGDGIDNVNGARVYIDEVRVYDKFLSDSEIQQAMNGVF